mmetsp:Transcript_29789/g.52297  ORF Transcript_29789/g.52297 Transcript_29789/m.52297 type:complete len:227 (+) Transcript_29789:346-1026(+)
MFRSSLTWTPNSGTILSVVTNVAFLRTFRPPSLPALATSTPSSGKLPKDLVFSPWLSSSTLCPGGLSPTSTCVSTSLRSTPRPPRLLRRMCSSTRTRPTTSRTKISTSDLTGKSSSSPKPSPPTTLTPLTSSLSESTSLPLPSSSASASSPRRPRRATSSPFLATSVTLVTQSLVRCVPALRNGTPVVWTPSISPSSLFTSSTKNAVAPPPTSTTTKSSLTLCLSG